MKLKNFWVKGLAQGRFKNGEAFSRKVVEGSDLSIENAKDLLINSIDNITKEWSLINRPLRKNADFQYDEANIVEELIERHGDNESLTHWGLTRNAYGCLILCTQGVLIADIDCDQGLWFGAKPINKPTGWTLFFHTLRSFTKKGRIKNSLYEKEKQIWDACYKEFQENHFSSQQVPKKWGTAILRLYRWIFDHPEHRFALYRTVRGFRAIEISTLWDPRSSTTQEVLSFLGSDGVYTSLCKKQNCFRARLEPKPWRIGLQRPTHRFPFENETQKNSQSEWLKIFDSKSKEYQAALFICEIGTAPAGTHQHHMKTIHDFHTKANGNSKLA